MTQLETLIQTLCPNGVKFVKLGDVVRVLRGKRLTKSDLLSEALYNVYHGGIDPLGKYNEANREGNTVMVINVGASAGSVGFSKDAFWSSDGCFCLSKNDLIDSKFLYYYLLTQEKHLQSKVRKAGIPTLDSLVIESLQIPLPPLAVQSEIVRILDKFTLYKAELAAELAARLQQYEYYRDQLLTFDDTVKRKELGELCTLVTKQTGFDYSNSIKDALTRHEGEDTVPYIQTKFFEGRKFIYKTDYYVPEKLVAKFPKITLDEKCILFSIVGASIGNIGLFPNVRKCFLGGAIGVAKFKKDVNIDFVYYYLCSKFGQKQIFAKVKGAGQATVTIEDLRKFSIPLPPLSEQERIVSILDRFDKLCHDIREGLPAEIELRQKQYEHYRDKLLTFEAKG